MDALDAIRSLFGYNHWANDRLLNVVEQVPVERLRESFGASSFDTIFGTAAHILQGELYYYSRSVGGELPTTWRPANLQTLDELRAHWIEQREQLDSFVRNLAPERLSDVVHFSSRDGERFALEIWQILLQMLNHGTHHRAELADLLTRAGHSPPAMDLIIYYQELAGTGT